MTDLLLVEKVAKAIADADDSLGYRIQLTSLIGVVSTYTLDYGDGSPQLTFESHGEAADHVAARRCMLRAEAAIATVEAHRPPVTVASLYGYEAGLVEGARAQWEPIESAPTEEWVNVVLLCRQGQPRSVMPGVFDGEQWRGLTLVGMIHYTAPTHWMPLPSPPSDGKEGAG